MKGNLKIVIAPDSFKESMGAKEVGLTIEKGVRRVFPQAEIIKVPMADGGEGTVESLMEARNGKIVEIEATSPLGKKICAYFGFIEDELTAIVEMAQASGLSLIPVGERNPLCATSYGTGELIGAALDRGCRKIIVGIGGSATVDGGAGMSQALGVRLLDKRGNEVSFGGGSLGEIVDINMEKFDARIADIEVVVASDVDNPLCGPEGAARVYGPQKGATPEMVDILNRNLAHFARMIKKFLGKGVADTPGAGAAGGLGAGLIAFLGAKIEPGIDLIIDASNLEEKLKGADLVISGEGRIDEQTAYGKTPMGVAERAKKENVPVILIGGETRIGSNVLYEKGVDALVSCVDRVSSPSEVMKNSRQALMDASERALRLVKIGCLL